MSGVLPLAITADWLQSPAGVVQVAAGAVLLLFGRRLFWLLVAAVGFFVGLELARVWIGADAGVWQWLVAVLSGALAAAAAVFLQRFAVSAAGALITGYCAWWYLALDGQAAQGWEWAWVAGAAALGLWIARSVFDFALIFLSSVAGATLLLEGLPVTQSASRWLFLVVVVLGAAVQAHGLTGRGKTSD